uniref:Zinc finger and Nuclear hormone receptor domain containing protein n=1 Tax=Haemonchus contortus TaxID=6289 RepID=A0A7I4YSA5_HAECO|nr:Zinc finger and Nuclear hormone receptor domain containing protein [Haemonchus contortus]
MSRQCEVCNKPAHGNHFGVNTCRACAAFFRRSVVQCRKYQCRKANGTCFLTEKENFICRFCRYQKCIALGMTPENVQLNRDVLSTVERASEKRNVPGGKKREQDELLSNAISASDEAHSNKEVAPCTKESALTKDRLTLDLSGVMTILRKIFSEQYRSSHEKRLLLRMYYALEDFRSSKTASIVFQEKVNFFQGLPTWERHLYEIAKWMMNCQDFAELPLEDKETLFKTSWTLWQRFERLQMTVQVFGEQAVKERVIVTIDNGAINMDTVQLEMGPLSDYDSESIKSMFDNFGYRLTDDVRRPLLEMNLDKYELSYILCALVWHVEGKNIQDSTRERAEKVIDQISDELHEHYTNDLKMPNYAARLTKIMEIISSVEKAQHQRAKLMELARIFDVFKYDLSEKGFLIC